MFIFESIDDSQTVKWEQVEEIVRELCVPYFNARRSFLNTASLIEDALNDHAITEAVRLMARVYRLPRGFLDRVGYSANVPSIAGLELQFDHAFSKTIGGTFMFQNSKKQLRTLPRYMLLHIIAHELAHARMAVDKHELFRSEFATDVLAILVSGNSKNYGETMISPVMKIGYIRHDLVNELYRCLAKYSVAIYLK